MGTSVPSFTFIVSHLPPPLSSCRHVDKQMHNNYSNSVWVYQDLDLPELVNIKLHVQSITVIIFVLDFWLIQSGNIWIPNGALSRIKIKIEDSSYVKDLAVPIWRTKTLQVRSLWEKDRPSTPEAETERPVTLCNITHAQFVEYQRLSRLIWSTDIL